MIESSPDPDRLSRRLCALHDRLASFPILAPEPRINALFGELVGLCSAHQPDIVADVLGDPRIKAVASSLRRLCAQGEYELEREWAMRVVDSPEPARELERFPYHRNYVQLVDLELHALLGLGRIGLRRAAFIGSGPLPLTAILLGQRFGMSVDSVDVKADAHGLAVKVSERLGMERSLRFHHCDVADFDCLQGFDVVFLAALVGRDRLEKRRIFAHLGARMRPGALLVVRTAAQLRTLLYPCVEVEDLVGFTPAIVLHPFNEVINSVIVAERPCA